MEGIHDIDVSWLHHSPKDHYSLKTQSSQLEKEADPAEKVASDPTTSHPDHGPAKTNGNTPTPSHAHHHIHRPHIGPRASSEKLERSEKSEAAPQIPAKAQKDQKPPAPSRRSSWVTSLSSKFSSNPSNAPTKSSDVLPPSKNIKSPPPEYSNPWGAAVSPGAMEGKKAPESPASTPPSSPGKIGHGFLQSAMRRLSSSGGAGIGKAAGSGGVCARKTMNVDPYRERCSLPELELRNLRRVAFCVDVEIAGAAQYPNADPEGPYPPPSIKSVSSLTRLEQEAEEKKKKKKNDQELRKSEGEALKRPATVADDKGTDGVVKASGEAVAPVSSSESIPPGQEVSKESTKKREKKKRSEGERKERKERKQRDALANGKIPAEIHREGSNGSTTDETTGADTPPKSQDKPTTDPLRIYRRCCQLRETPILKRIAEQISSPSACHTASPGVLSNLDLTGYWIQLPDLITLGDYLAVVPVKRLILENCGLGDEAVRVILAGLLAAKTPEQAKYNRKLLKKHPSRPEALEMLGVVEKVSFKNNPKIGKDGWRHIALFIHMSRSLKAIDLSMISFPQYSGRSDSIRSQTRNEQVQMDMPSIFQEAISSRLAGDRLEELVMAECNLTADSVGQIVDAVINCGSRRLGIASNDLTKEGFEHVLRYVRSGKCDGLDIGGNSLRNWLDDLAGALDDKCSMFALSLADCKLAPSSLEKILPALIRLPNFRFIDLSHNRDLFASSPSVLKLIRRYLPQFPILKRLHLLDTSMTPEHAIALAEVLPECKALAHLNILENHLLAPLANAKTENEQEEACAMYASFMVAVRVSASIIAIDIDVPSPESSEIVKALAKQVVAYCLRNLENLPLTEPLDSTVAAMKEPHGGEAGLAVSDILLQLVGHVEGCPDNHDNDAPAPDEDYIVGGTGVVKALDICLKRAADGRNSSLPGTPTGHSGPGTPQQVLSPSHVTKGKAKEMSSSLLESARKIRARLQPALVKEARTGTDMNYRRLQFLDNTLQGMIQRFEDEYPETRLPNPIPSSTLPADDNASSPSSQTNSTTFTSPAVFQSNEDLQEDPSDALPLRRASSAASLAALKDREEGRMHRFGQQLRREILKPELEDYAHGTMGTEDQPRHLQELRRRLEELEGPEIEERMKTSGPEEMLRAIGVTAEDLARLEMEGESEGVQGLRERAREISGGRGNSIG